MLVCWDKWIVNQASDVPSIIMFFMISCKIRCRNGFNLFFCFFHEFTKIEIKSYVCSKSVRNLKKKMLGTSDAWSIVHLSQQTSVSYSRLTDLKLVQSRKVFSLWSHFKKKSAIKLSLKDLFDIFDHQIRQKHYSNWDTDLKWNKW